MKRRHDAFLSSPFRLEWSSPEWSANEREEVERGVALAAAAILRAARFSGLLHTHQGVETEVRVWLETGTVPVQVATWWEEGRGKFWFAVVDAVARERIALVVFRDVQSVTLDEMRSEEASLLASVRSIVPRPPRIPEDAGL